jgi:hypothetical protein
LNKRLSSVAHRYKTARALSVALGVAEGTVSLWKKRGMPIEPDGTFDLLKIRDWRFGGVGGFRSYGKVWDGAVIEAMDLVPICQCEDCKLVHCAHRGKNKDCGVVKNYIYDIISLYRWGADYADNLAHQRLGMMVLPLWAQLARLLIEQYTIESLMVESVQGSRKVHPVFKEIRETISAISRLEVQYNIIPKNNGDGRNPSGPCGPFPKKVNEYIDGKTGFYEEMSGSSIED